MYMYHSVNFEANSSSDVRDMISILSYRILETFGSFWHPDKYVDQQQNVMVSSLDQTTALVKKKKNSSKSIQ